MKIIKGDDRSYVEHDEDFENIIENQTRLMFELNYYKKCIYLYKPDDCKDILILTYKYDDSDEKFKIPEIWSDNYGLKDNNVLFFEIDNIKDELRWWNFVMEYKYSISRESLSNWELF